MNASGLCAEATKLSVEYGMIVHTPNMPPPSVNICPRSSDTLHVVTKQVCEICRTECTIYTSVQLPCYRSPPAEYSLSSGFAPMFDKAYHDKLFIIFRTKCP